MRINRYIALSTGMGRRAADNAIASQRVRIDGKLVSPGENVPENATVTLDNHLVTLPLKNITVLFNKPIGYVCSRNGQGSKTIYDLLPQELQTLKSIGRLDKDSSGLLLLTNDGALAHTLTHPSRQKTKIYEVTLNKPLQSLHQQIISDYGVMLDDGPSKFVVERMLEDNAKKWRITMHEGRNRQIRRTFTALGYRVTGLHRTHFGPYALQTIAQGTFKRVT